MRQLLSKHSNLLISITVLVCIIVAYFIPNNAEGSGYFAAQVIPSTIFVFILYAIQQYKYTPRLSLIIAIEILSTIINLSCCLLYLMALKTAYIYVHYGDIITVMFIAELAIIMGALIRDVGIYTNSSSLRLRNCLADWHIVSFRLPTLSIRKASACKTQ